jgi:hypothetical protein
MIIRDLNKMRELSEDIKKQKKFSKNKPEDISE